MATKEPTPPWVVDIKDLRDGENPVTFEVSDDQFHGFVQEVDDLYCARGACRADLTVTRLSEMLLLTGTVSGPLTADCARCLKELDRPLDLRLQWTLLPKTSLADDVSPEDELELTTDDLDTSFYEGDEINLLELVREAILLELDSIPRCDVDECDGSAYEQPPADAGKPALDPRWAPLLKLKENKS